MSPRPSSGPPDRWASTNTAGWFAADGVGPDLFAAARDAVRRMIDRLGAEHGAAAVDANLLLSVAGDLRISGVVDQPNWIATCQPTRAVHLRGEQLPARRRPGGHICQARLAEADSRPA